MRVVSFNINSIRARIHQLEALVKTLNPDIIALQETKVDNEQFPIKQLAHLGYHLYFHGQKAHYGVAILSKQKAKKVIYGLPNDDDEAQKRLITAQFSSNVGCVSIINGYFPQGESQDHLTKYPAKRKFYAELNDFITDQNLHQASTLLVGDLNICATDLDIGLTDVNKKRWLSQRKCSFLPEEREWIQRLFDLEFTDVYREKHPENTKYSWFDYRSQGFESNIGLRIDYILASASISSSCRECDVDLISRAMEKTSDHAPLWADFDVELLPPETD